MLKSCLALTLAVKSTWEQLGTDHALGGVLNVAQGTRMAVPTGRTALPEGGPIPSPSPDTLYINCCLHTKCAQKIQTADYDITFL